MTANEAVADLQKALIEEHEDVPLLEKWRSDPTGVGSTDQVLKTPGGFRREFLSRKADSAGIPVNQRPASWNRSLLQSLRPLVRVGYFESVLGIRMNNEGQELPLPKGDMKVFQIVLTLLKSFIGAGITFLPGAFANGGWLFSAVFLIGIGICNALCARLLLDCAESTGSSNLGDIASLATGSWGRFAVQISLVVAQFGSNIAYIIFAAQMAESLGSSVYLTRAQLVAVEILLVVPLCLIKNVQSLEYPILGADALIIFGLVAAVVYNLGRLWTAGASPELEAFKTESCGLFIGTAIFIFEGIPTILPIRSSMEEPEKFWSVFTLVFAAVLSSYVVFALSGYFAYGPKVEQVVLLSMPAGDPIVTAARAGYALAMVLGSPLCFLPAARVTELWAFGIVKPGNRSWAKNALRAAEVCCFGIVASYGGAYFDKFLAIVGAVCCAPIAFIYPALFHLRLCACSLQTKVLDFFFIVQGIVAMIFVLLQVLT